MEYFTLENDLKEIQASKAKSRKLIFISLTIIAALALMRAFGVITLEYHKAYFQGNHQAQKEILKLDGEDAWQDAKWNSIKSNDEDFKWELGFDFKFLSRSPADKKDEYSGDKKYLEELIKEKLAGERNLNGRFEVCSVLVGRLEMTGLYWFPLVKNAKSSYRVSVENRVFQDIYSANFSGEINSEVYGFCTIDRLKKNIAEKIAKTIVDSIKDDYKK
jgi:hypothetical protein